MKIHGAVVEEQGVTFAIVAVKMHVIQNGIEADETLKGFKGVFPGAEVVLMGQDARGVPTYYGRNDIARFLSRIPLNAIPWKEYTVSS
jgi:hypothetical protein